jgi:hypothetical protein
VLCPSCRSTLFAGAFECRFCGKKLPQPKSARLPGLMLIGILVFIAGVVAYGAYFRTDAQDEVMRLRQAAGCSGAGSVRQLDSRIVQLQDAARQMAAKTGMSMFDAMHRVEHQACPSMNSG